MFVLSHSHSCNHVLCLSFSRSRSLPFYSFYDVQVLRCFVAIMNCNWGGGISVGFCTVYVCAFAFSFQMLSLLPDVRYATLNCPPCVPRYSARQFNRPPTDRPLATIIVYLIILFLSSLRGRLRRLRRRMTDEWVSVSVSRCYHWFYINSQHSCLLEVLLCSRYC